MSGGGGGQTTYDDQWIRDAEARLSQNVADLGKQGEYRHQEHLNQQAYLEALSDINTTQSAQLGTLFDHNEMTAGINETQSTQIGDLYKFKDEYGAKLSELENLYGTGTGASTIADVSGLDNIIKDLQSKYDSVSGYDTRMSDSLNDLGKTLRGEFETGIEDLKIPDYTEQLNQISDEYATTLGDLDQLRSSFGDFQQQSATTLGNVQSAL